MGNMIPRSLSLCLRDRGLPFVPSHKLQIGWLTEPGRHRFGITAQSQRCLRNNMAAFTDGQVAVRECLHKGLSHVVSMDMMDGFHTQIREDQCLAPRQGGKHFWIEVSRGVE